MGKKKATEVIVFLCVSTTLFCIFYELNFAIKIKNILLLPIVNLSQNVGYQHKYKSLEEIHNVIKQQIHKLQEEGNCEEKKILFCKNVQNFYGFGSNVHRYGVCMQVAYGLGRMFFIEQDEYSHFDGVFQWVKPESYKCGYLKKKFSVDKSQTCNAQDPSCYLKNGYDINNTHRVIEFNTIKNTFPYPRHVPGTLPEKLKENLSDLGVKFPWLWFTSQFLAYLLLRPNDRFNTTFSTMKKHINYTSPIVGFHIRHGDKITLGEAEYVNETVFVKKANDYFDKNNVGIKRIYIASDDLPAIKTVNKLLSPNIFTTSLPANYLSFGLGNYFQKNFSKEIIESTLLDLYFLSNADCLVCDIASNLCRLAFELKQGLPPFRQNNVLKPVGEEKDIYYRWYDFVYPFSLWIASSNKLSSNLNDIIRIIRTVSTTENVPFEQKNGFYCRAETTTNNLTDVWLIKKITYSVKQGSKYAFSGTNAKYVYKNDLIEWPGRPTYHFFT
nr:alpha-(1,6)-fucosyltransferase-like [Hydra vulgaris]